MYSKMKKTQNYSLRIKKQKQKLVLDDILSS